jgi:hypothetical protein
VVSLLSTILFGAKLVKNFSNNLHNYIVFNGAKPVENPLEVLICYISFCPINLLRFLSYSCIFLRVIDLVKADV